MDKKTKVKIALAVMALLAAVIGGTSVYMASDNGTTTSSVGSSNRDNQCIVAGNVQSLNCNKGGIDQDPSYSTSQDPAGPGPWAYRVVNTIVGTKDQGLFVRSCDHESCGCTVPGCARIGLAWLDNEVYAICQEKSDFNGNDNSDNMWLKIKWPTDTPGATTPRTSSPSDPYTGWVLRIYTTPAGHDGKIPACT